MSSGPYGPILIVLSSLLLKNNFTYTRHNLMIWKSQYMR